MDKFDSRRTIILPSSAFAAFVAAAFPGRTKEQRGVNRERC
jgi:hypothetical protein